MSQNSLSTPAQAQLSEEFSNDLSDDAKTAIANAIWGQDAADAHRLARLKYFFNYYIFETIFTKILETSTRPEVRIPLKTHAEIIHSIGLLRQRYTTLRQTIKQEWHSGSPPTAPPELDVDGALDLTVRVMFMVACRSPTAYNMMAAGHIFRPLWKADESLEMFLKRIFPRYRVDEGCKTDAINGAKLAISYLKDYAEIDIIWTNHLPDHLTLHKTDRWKSLYIFRQAGFLQTCSRARPHSQESPAALPLDLVNETLRTMDLLFPPMDDKCRAILLADIQETCGPFKFYSGYHEVPGDSSLPEDVKTLFETYPYWGDRLYKLWKEADNPTPMSPVGRWSESKKSPRFTYWVTVTALCFAIFFGVAATALGATQVWISYCTWKDGSAVIGCGKHL